MDQVSEMEMISPVRRSLTANSNSSSFPSKVPTVTEPANDGVIHLTDPRASSGFRPKRIKLWPIGLGSNNDGFSMRVIGWTRAITNTETNLTYQAIWIPSILAEVTCLMGNVTGVASSPVLDTELFCDTITIVAARQRFYSDLGTVDATTTGPAGRGSVEILSPTNDTPGYLVVAVSGFEKLEFTFDQTTNTPTMNVLHAYL